jgi:serine/threonine-protein kinase
MPTRLRVSESLESTENIVVGANADARLDAGTRVGDYEIRGLIDCGGMATVYSAVHPLIGKEVAIKVLGAAFSADAGVVDRFIQEARAVNRIRHVNIVDIFSIGKLDGGRHYCVMELLAGESLDKRLGRMPGPTYEELFSILCQVADALEAAHKAGIVHRDLKPENVFLVPGADGPVVKLLDFGIAKVFGRDEQRPGRPTLAGILLGTPEYMAPEQCAARDVDARTDVYALGVIMYQVFTGRLPFEGGAPMEIISGHLSHEPPPPDEIATFAPALAELVMACLSKDPAGRPPRAVDVHDRLLEIACDPALDLAVLVPAPDPAAALRPRLSSGARAARASSQRGAVTPRRTLSARVGLFGGGAVVAGLAVVGLIVVVARFASADPQPPAPAPFPSPVDIGLPFQLDEVALPEPEAEPAPEVAPEPASEPAVARSVAARVIARPAGKAAVIDELSFDPPTAIVGHPTTVTGTVRFADPDGDVNALGSQIRPPTSVHARVNPKIRMTLKGARTGFAAFTFVLRPTATGTHSFDVWVVDAGRNLSNVLTGQIEVTPPPSAEPAPEPAADLDTIGRSE